MKRGERDGSADNAKVESTAQAPRRSSLTDAQLDDMLATAVGLAREKMQAGDFASAISAVDTLPGMSETRKAVVRRPLRSSERVISTGTLAELYAYVGDNAAARALFRDYLKRANRSILLGAPTVPVRIKLQLAEVIYASRQFDAAIDVARQILEQAIVRFKSIKKEEELWDIGEASYYLARYHSRKDLNAPTAVYCAKALECFSRADTSGRRAWRTGQVLLVQSHSDWRSGRLSSAQSRLYVARSLLQEGGGDIISIGNAEQTLGCILRSQGKYAEAMDAFGRARIAYERLSRQHDLNLSRVHTNIGRTALLAAEWGLARTHFGNARDICNAHIRSNPKDPMWLRQKAEVLIWQSRFLYSSDRLNQNLDEAKRCARQALKLATRRKVASRSNSIEAHLCIGHCAISEHDSFQAIPSFRDALSLAVDLGLAKLVVCAHLSLAEAFVNTSDVRAADSHHSKATDLMAETAVDLQSDSRAATLRATQDVEVIHESKFSAFLRKKADEIRAAIDSSGVQKLIVTGEQIRSRKVSRTGIVSADRLTLADVTKRARKWAIDVAMQKANGRIPEAADMLGITRQALYQLRQSKRVEGGNLPQRGGLGSRATRHQKHARASR